MSSMLMPTLSVTVLGLLGAAAVVAVTRSLALRRLVAGLAGAWVGFLFGGLVGLAVDIVTGGGAVLAIAGHAAALAGAMWAAVRLPGPLGRVEAPTAE